MMTYTIKELGEISGIKPHTIRIWEQRYNLFTPSRTDTNIRRYDDEDLKKLLNVTELINRGAKISKVSKLSVKEISEEIDKVIEESFHGSAQMNTIINQLLISIATYDEFLFDKVLTNCISKFGIINTYITVIYPLLVKTGLMWSNDDFMPAQEHFMSNIIRQKLFTAIEYWPLPKEPKETWMLFLSENEEHEIGLLFANLILRMYNKKVIYLGSNVPYKNLFNATEASRATHIFTFFVRNQSEEDLKKYIDKLGADFKFLKIFVSGNSKLLTKLSLSKNMTLIKDVNSLIEEVKNK